VPLAHTRPAGRPISVNANHPTEATGQASLDRSAAFEPIVALLLLTQQNKLRILSVRALTDRAASNCAAA
jgi:hypothetical protein